MNTLSAILFAILENSLFLFRTSEELIVNFCQFNLGTVSLLIDLRDIERVLCYVTEHALQL